MVVRISSQYHVGDDTRTPTSPSGRWRSGLGMPSDASIAMLDTYAGVDRGRLQEQLAFKTTRRASSLWKAVHDSGSFPVVDGEMAVYRERLARLNHERLAHLYLLDELKELAEGGTALVTLWVDEDDGVIRTVEQHVWRHPVGSSPVMIELQRVGCFLRINWLDCTLLGHELAVRWFASREGSVIEPPADPAEYVFAGNDMDVLRYNRQRLDDLFDISGVASLDIGDTRFVAVWIERESGLIDAYALDLRAAGQRDGLVYAIAEVEREDRHGLIVRFVDTASVEGIPQRVLEWFRRPLHSVMDPRRVDEGTQPPMPAEDGCSQAMPVSPRTEEPTIDARQFSQPIPLSTVTPSISNSGNIFFGVSTIK